MKRSIFLLILCSILITNQTAQAADPSLVQSGYNYIKKGYIQNAVPVFQQAVKLYPNNLNAHLGLGIATSKQGGANNFKIAVEQFKKVLDIDPNNITALQSAARILSWNPKTRDEALIFYEKAVVLNPKDLDLLSQYAEVLMWSQQYEKALPIYEKLYKINPQKIDLTVSYADALSGTKNYSESILLYEKAHRNNYSLKRYSKIGYAAALQHTGHKDEALRIYESLLSSANNKQEANQIKNDIASAYFEERNYTESLSMDQSIDPKTKEVELRIARAFNFSGQKDEAIKAFEELYTKYPDDIEVKKACAQFLSSIGGYNINASKIYEEICQAGQCALDDKINLANLYNASGVNRNNAITMYKDLLSSPGISKEQEDKIKLSLADTLASVESDRQEAAALYRQLMQEAPGDIDIRIKYLELLSWDKSTRKEALDGYYDLIKRYPNDNKVQKGFNETLSWYLPNENDLNFYEELLKEFPDNVNALKGLAYIVSNDPNTQARAMEIYNKLLSNDPDNIDLQNQIANLLAKNKDTRKEAIEKFKKVHDHNPENLDVTINLANNLLYEHKYKEAKDLFDKILANSPDNKDALLGKARVYNWQGLDLAALKAYSVAYEKYPDDADIAYEYAGVAKKLGQNAKAMKILKKLGNKSYLPDAPEAPVVAMAGNFQAMSLETKSGIPSKPQDVDLTKLQNDLDNIQKELEKLQAGLKELNMDKSKASAVTTARTTIETKNNKINNPQKVEPVQLMPQRKVEIITSKPIKTINDDSLPDPVSPKTPLDAKITYKNDYVYKQPDILDSSRSVNDADIMREIVFKNDLSYDDPDSANCMSITTFDDILSGRKSMILNERFGSLEKDLMYSMRPEVRPGFFLSNNSGNPTNAGMETYGFPNIIGINITPQNRFRFGVSSFTYGQSQKFNPASITETAYTLGLTSRPHERLLLDGQLTISSFSDPYAPVDLTGNALISVKVHDRAKLNLAFRREPFYQSVFETAGYTLRPQYSPTEFTNMMFIMRGPGYNPDNNIYYNAQLANPNFYNNLIGPFMGMVRDNAFTAEWNFTPFNKWDVNMGYEYSSITGRKITRNSRHQGMFSFGRTFTGVKDHLFRLGYQFLYFGYAKDLSAVPNMTPYPYVQNGQLIPVTRQMDYNEANIIANNKWASPEDIYSWATAQLTNPNAPLVVSRYLTPADITMAPQGVGIGGYFSPSRFYLNSFRLDFEGKLWNGRLAYKGGGSLGVQHYDERTSTYGLLASRGLLPYQNLPVNDPRRNNAAFNANCVLADNLYINPSHTSLASAFDLTFFLKITNFLTLYSGVDFLKTGGYDRWSYTGGLMFKPGIKALTPAFRKVKAEDPTNNHPETDTENSSAGTNVPITPEQ